MTGIIIRPSHVAAQQFSVDAPLATHWERATCEDVDCAEYLNGWMTILPWNSPLINTLRTSGRRFTEERSDDGMIRFVFSPGQECFRSSLHRAGNGRPADFLWRNREEGRSPARVVGEGEWQERFEETLDGLDRERKEHSDG